MALRAQCTSCGAPIAFENKVSLFAVCAHCSCAVLRHDLNLEKLGAMAELADDGSPLQIGSRGRYRGSAFRVLGRIQLSFPSGFWNEWFLDYADNRIGWLGEAQGAYAVNFPEKPPEKIPAFRDLAPGEAVTLNGTAYYVRDVQEATCVSGEGELPFRIEGGYHAPVADLAGEGGRFATLDYSDGAAAVYTGEYQDFQALALENLRPVEGW